MVEPRCPRPRRIGAELRSRLSSQTPFGGGSLPCSDGASCRAPEREAAKPNVSPRTGSRSRRDLDIRAFYDSYRQPGILKAPIFEEYEVASFLR